MSLKNRVMDSSVFTSSVFSSLTKPWIVSFLIPILTYPFINFTIFIIINIIIITCLILSGSASLFFTNSKTEENKDSNQINSNQGANDEIKDVGIQDSCSESEIIDPVIYTTEEDSEFDVWEYSGEACRRGEYSDGSISDEESLIEIELFGGKYDGYKGYKGEEEPKTCRRKKSPDSVLWWPEMSEEENMIEIDLSVGSIKC